MNRPSKNNCLRIAFCPQNTYCSTLSRVYPKRLASSTLAKGREPRGKHKTDVAKELSMVKSDSATNIRKHFTAIKLRLEKRNAERNAAYV